jgi:hypothetical protein
MSTTNDSFLLSIEAAASELAGKREQINAAWEALRVSVRVMHPDYDLMNTGKVARVNGLVERDPDNDRRTTPVHTARFSGVPPQGIDETGEDYYARLKRRILWFVENQSREELLGLGRDAVLSQLLETKPAGVTDEDVVAALDSLRIPWITDLAQTAEDAAIDRLSEGITSYPPDSPEDAAQARAEGQTVTVEPPADEAAEAPTPPAEATKPAPTPDEAPAEKPAQTPAAKTNGKAKNGKTINAPHWSTREQVVQSEQFLHDVYEKLVGKTLLPQELIKALRIPDNGASKSKVGAALREMNDRGVVERTGERRRPKWETVGRFSDEWRVARQWKDRDGNIWEKSPANAEAINPPQ